MTDRSLTLLRPFSVSSLPPLMVPERTNKPAEEPTAGSLYVHSAGGPVGESAASLLTKDEARRTTANRNAAGFFETARLKASRLHPSSDIVRHLGEVS